jgi:hypothetical protein
MKITEDPEKGQRHFATQSLAFFTLAVVGYVLSVGPVLSVAERLDSYHTPFYKPLRAFYSPVFAIVKSSDVTTHLYENYARMWCRIVLPPGSPGT